MNTMIDSITDLPKESFAANGQRRPESWPRPLQPTGLAHVLQHTPLRFVSAAQWRWREGTFIANRILPTTNLAYYLAGRGTVWVAGEAQRVEPGVLLITPRGWPQRVAHDPGHPFQALALHAQMPVFGGELDLPAALGLPLRLELEPKADAVVPIAMEELARLDACRPASWHSSAAAWLTVLVHHLVARFAPPSGPALPASHDVARLAPVLAHIDEQLSGGPIPLADLARLLGLSPVACRRVFQRVTGRSPNRYIQARRVERAGGLLRQGQPIAQVAAAVGCADANVLHRLFRRWTGLTPEAWRRGVE